MEAGDCDFPGHPPARDNTLVCVGWRPPTVGKYPALILLSATPPCSGDADMAVKQQSGLRRLLLRLPTAGERSADGGGEERRVVVKGHLHRNGPGSVTPAEKVKHVPGAFWL